MDICEKLEHNYLKYFYLRSYFKNIFENQEQLQGNFAEYFAISTGFPSPRREGFFSKAIQIKILNYIAFINYA